MNKSSDTSGRGKNKRKWSFQEEEVLLDYVFDLKGDPKWKCEGGFKTGFCQHLEQLLEVKYPGGGLKASQIESKIKFMKEKYTIINEMIKLSGFTWDDQTNMINCERQAYEDFCKLHPRARGLWKTAFPLFNKLELIFGLDRANGGNSEDVEDMVYNMDTEFVDLDKELDGMNDSSNDGGSRQPLSKRQRVGKSPLGVTQKSDINDKFSLDIDEIKVELRSIASTILKSQNRDEEVVQQKKLLLSEISMLGFADRDAVVATRILSKSINKLDAFYSCPNDGWKKFYVDTILEQVQGSSGASQD